MTESGRNDMIVLNETGADAGRYLFRTHETTDNASVVRIDMLSGVAVTIFQSEHLERLDGLRWTPWGTLITGEEVKLATIPDPSTQSDPALLAVGNDPSIDDMLHAYSGVAYEILDPTGPAPSGIARPDLGGLSHEGFEVDSQGFVYVMDEYALGSIYRFVPDDFGDLSSGQLQVLRVVSGDVIGIPQQEGLAEWIDLDMSHARISARGAAELVSGTLYDRPEDAEVAIRNGVEYLYVPITGEHRVLSISLGDTPEVKVFADTRTTDVTTDQAVGNAFQYLDNITVDASGNIFVTEDAPDEIVSSQGVGNDVWKITDQDGDGIAETVARFASLSTVGAEPTGVYIDPLNHAHMYLNVQHPDSGNDMTIRIVSESGNFASFDPISTSVALGRLDEDSPFELPRGFNAEIISQRDPFVIFAHRGASGDLPEHTLEAYQLALNQGADALEIDLLVTSDGFLIARHDVTLDATTNVASVFGSNRIATKVVDGANVTGFFVEDFSLAEIKTLGAVQPREYRDQSFNGLFEIPTFEETIALINAHEDATGVQVSIFPELKHPTYHRQSGNDIEQIFIDALLDSEFTNPLRTKIQAFEIESLIRIKGLLNEVMLGGIEITQAIGKSRLSADPENRFHIPYDVHFNVAQGNDLQAIYGEAILDALIEPLSMQTTWNAFVTPAVLEAMKDTYLDGLSVWTRDIILRQSLTDPVDGNGDGNAEINFQQTGEVSTLINDARLLGITSYAFTPKDEERFQSLTWDDFVQTPESEIALLASLGLNGVVTDFVDTAVAAVALPMDAQHLVGTHKNDTLEGSGLDDVISAGNGDDRVYDLKGTDLVFLGSGDDYIRVGGGQDQFDGGSGTDYISYYDSSNGITANLATNSISGSWAVNDSISSFEGISGSRTGDDTIYGTSDANKIRTFGGDDRVYAGAGRDDVKLGSGDDYVRVGGGTEIFDGGDGKDYISYFDSKNGITIDFAADTVSGSWAVNDTVINFESGSGSGTGDDKMYGTSGSNTLKGFGGDDKLFGRSGNDKLYGGSGNDRFDGGGGTDRLFGGAGEDIFHFDFGEGHDTVEDFENNVDTIELDNFTFAEGLDAFDFAKQVNGDVIFDFGGGDMLTVLDATKGQLLNDLSMV